MARYKQALVGVIDTQNGNALVKPHGEGWADYLAWSAIPGNTPDPPDPPAVTPLDERRARCRSKVQFYMQQHSMTGVDAAGAHFNFDDYDFQCFIYLVAASLGGGGLPSNFQWRSSTGVLVSLNANSMKLVVQQYAARLYALLSRRWQIEAAIDASTDPESINADDFAGI